MGQEVLAGNDTELEYGVSQDQTANTMLGFKQGIIQANNAY